MIAMKKLTEQVMDRSWMSENDPLFTTFEVYDAPGSNRYLGLDSNRSVVHQEPETPIRK